MMQTPSVTPTQVNANQVDTPSERTRSGQKTDGTFESALSQEARKHQHSNQNSTKAANVAANRDVERESSRAEERNSVDNESERAQEASNSRRESDTEQNSDSKDFESRNASDDKDEQKAEAKNKDWHAFLESVYDRLQELDKEGDGSAPREHSLKLDTFPLYHGDPVDEDGRVIKFELDKDASEQNDKVTGEVGDSDNVSEEMNQGSGNEKLSDEEELTLDKLLSGLNSDLSEEELEKVADLLQGEQNGSDLRESDRALLAKFYDSVDVSGLQQQLEALSQDNVALATLSLEDIASLEESLSQLIEGTKLLNREDLSQLESHLEGVQRDIAQLKEVSRIENEKLSEALQALKAGDEKPLEDWLAKLEISENQRQMLKNELVALTQQLDVRQLQQHVAELNSAKPLPHSVNADTANKENPVLKAFESTASKARESLNADTSSKEQASQQGHEEQSQHKGLRMQELLSQASQQDFSKAPVSTANSTTSVGNTVNASSATFAQQLNQTQAANQNITPIEQARQMQQHIDLFGPQAPQNLRDQVMTMVNSRQQYAELRLDPPELGRLQIRIQMNNDNQASVQFQVANPQAREAIEQALPKLRDMLEQQGLQLTESDVQEGTTEQQRFSKEQNGQGGTGSSAEDNNLELEEADNMQAQWIDVDSGRVDYYA